MSDERLEKRAEELVSEHLRQKTASIDAASLLAKVQDRLDHEPPVTSLEIQAAPSRRTGLWMGVAGSVLAALLLGTWILWSGPEASAALREIVRAHRMDVDRVYRIELAPDEAAPLLLRYLAKRPGRLTTNGDRFVVEPEGDGRTLTWGSEGRDTGLWAALPGSFGLRISSQEAHDRLIERLTDLRTLDLQRVLDSLTLDYDLEIERGINGVMHIEGERRPGTSRPYSAVRLVTRSDAPVVDTMELDLERDGRPIGTMRFVFQEQVERRPERYRLASYLDPNDLVIERTGLPFLNALSRLVELLSE
ncbi:MAG: hypothetical protein RL885_08705 [Planctomycetota bacterium]